jgi:hypothetical protein
MCRASLTNLRRMSAREHAADQVSSESDNTYAYDDAEIQRQAVRTDCTGCHEWKACFTCVVSAVSPGSIAMTKID